MIVEAHSLVKRFDSLTAVDNMSFNIPEGQIFGLLGPNGAGKSTTISVLFGIGHFTINAWALDGINGLIIQGEGFTRILQPAAVLFAYGSVCFIVGLKLFRFR